ncbi:hypothetical protein OH805_08825 [Streptomyces sp. NBC_00879]|uniref:hypothetical protein n=1 Tax=Streptomyces sp. NBC_00879 TaxID=2975855 RepID=UPI003866F4D7|nr:hypothetical protein OH805_08825 [Streptomyces sp. NBC_00879]
MIPSVPVFKGGVQRRKRRLTAADRAAIEAMWAERDPADPVRALSDLVGVDEACWALSMLTESADVRLVAAAAGEDEATETAVALFRSLGATIVDTAVDPAAVAAAEARLERVAISAWRIADERDRRHGRPRPAVTVNGYTQPNAGRAGNLTGVVRTLLETTEGARNDVLLWCACRAAEAVRDGLVDAGAAEETLVDAAAEIGLGESEARATIRSGFHQRDRRGGESHG